MKSLCRWLLTLSLLSGGALASSPALDQVESIEPIPRQGVLTGPAGSNVLSPDGSHVATTWDDRFRDFHATGDRIYIYNVELNRYTATVDLPHRLCEPTQLAVSDRAEFVAFCRRNGSSFEYWLYDTIADSSRLLIAIDDTATPAPSRLAISPNGAVIAFVSSSKLDELDSNEAADVYTVDTATGLLRLGSVDEDGNAIGDVETFSLNRHGRLVFRHQSELRLLGPRGISRLHFNVPDSADDNVLISRNQRAAIYTTNNNETVMLSRIGHPPEVIDGPNLGCSQLNMTLSRSGRFVAARWLCPTGTSFVPFVNRTEVIDTRPNGRRIRTHTPGIAGLQLSDLGTQLLIEGEELVWLFNRRQNDTQPLWLESGQSLFSHLARPSGFVSYFGDGSLSPDGGYSVTPLRNGIRIYDISQQRHTMTVDLPHSDCSFPTYALSNLAEKVVLCRMNGFILQYWLLDTTTRSLRRLISYTPNGDVFGHGNNSVQLSPDGSHMAFMTRVSLSELDTNSTYDVYLIDTRTRTLSLASADQSGLATGLVKTFTLGDDAKLAFVNHQGVRRFYKNAGLSVPWIDLPPTAGQGTNNFRQNFRISRNLKVALFPNGTDGKFTLAYRSGAPNETINAPGDSCTQALSDLSGNGQGIVLTWHCQQADDSMWLTDIINASTGSRARLHTRYVTFPELSDNARTVLFRGDEVPWVYVRPKHHSKPLRLME